MRVALWHNQVPIGVDLKPLPGGYRAVVDGKEHAVEFRRLPDESMALVIDGQMARVHVVRSGSEQLVAIAGEVYRFALPSGDTAAPAAAAAAPPEVMAPMPGKVVQVLVRAGDEVASGDTLLILEAMKMETRLCAEAAGKVSEVRVREGEMVDGGQVLLVMEYASSA